MIPEKCTIMETISYMQIADRMLPNNDREEFFLHATVENSSPNSHWTNKELCFLGLVSGSSEDIVEEVVIKKKNNLESRNHELIQF